MLNGLGTAIGVLVHAPVVLRAVASIGSAMSGAISFVLLLPVVLSAFYALVRLGIPRIKLALHNRNIENSRYDKRY